MKIEIWSDFMCPFCYMGQQRLQKAIEKFGHEVEVVYRTFQLFPGFRPQLGKNLYESIALFKGADVGDIAKLHDRLAQTGKLEGLEFNFGQVVPTDTTDALRLIHFAKEMGKSEEFIAAVFKGYFTDVLDIGDHLTLIQLADSVGLDPQLVEQVLLSGAYTEELEKDRQTGQAIGVKGVPFYVIDNRYAISGAQESAVFLEVLEKARLEEEEDGGSQCCSDCTCGKRG
ncbi:MAG: DsbA family oxidoreductase [Turicibacter sp.]|nr:DsbA family oxidoreductase [Turicibacter sp.]